ncbi:MAG: hypothetical protein CBARDCOR_6367, partial [uncultured Caballeronia sp.]
MVGSLGSGNIGVALNLYYLFGFPLNALSAYVVLRKLRVSTILSFAGGFIFTILPFHFERLGHLFYNWYFSAPVFIWYAFKIYRGEFTTNADKPRSRIGYIKTTLTLLGKVCITVFRSAGLLLPARCGVENL